MVLEINTRKGLGKTFIMEKKNNHVIVYLGEKRNYDVAELFEIAEKIEDGKFKLKKNILRGYMIKKDRDA